VKRYENMIFEILIMSTPQRFCTTNEGCLSLLVREKGDQKKKKADGGI